MTTLPQKTNSRFPKPGNGSHVIPMTGPTPMLHGGQNSPPPALTPSDVWRVLRSSMWFIIGIMILSLVLGGVAYVLLGKYASQYLAKAQVQVEPPRQFDVSRTIQSQASREAIELQQRTQATMLMQPSLFGQVLGNETSEVRQTEWWKQFASIEEAKEDLARHFSASPQPGTMLIQVSMEASNPRDAKIIVTAIVDQHIKNRVASYTSQTLAWSQTLSRLIQAHKTQRDARLRTMNDLMVELNSDGGGAPGSLSPKEFELSDLIKRQSELLAMQSTAKTQLDAVTQRLQNGEDPPTVLSRIDTDPMVINYKQQIDMMDMELAIKGSELGNEHTQTQQLRKRRDVLQQKLDDTVADLKGRTRVALLDELQGAVASADAQLEQLRTQLNDLQVQIAMLKQKQGQYQRLLQEENDSVARAALLQAQYDQIANVTSQREMAGIDWAGPAETPDRRSFPTIPMTMATALGLGLLVSIGFAFLRELLDTTLRNPRDIARVGHVNVLGLIPDESDDPEAADVRLPLTIAEAPQSIIAEHIRQVRTRLQQAASLDTTRSILITSPDPQDGKTTISCNLAAGLALNGRKILLVDSNFRRPALHEVFNISNDVGFSDVLTAPDMLAQCVRDTEVPNLSVLPSGPKPGNATELLESQLLIDFIEQALEEYDHVIFDSGPLLFVSDAVALAPRVDGVITVLRAKRSTRGVLQRTRDVLRQLKAEHIGVVLNGVRSHGGGYYGRNIRTYYAYTNEEKSLAKR